MGNNKIVSIVLALVMLLSLAGCTAQAYPGAGSGGDSSVVASMAPDGAETGTAPEGEPGAAPDAAAQAVQPGMVRGKVLLDSGEMVPTGIIIEDETGKIWRTTTNELAGYNLRLAPGDYKLTFTRGSEYSTVEKEVTVESYKVNYQQDVRLVQMKDLYADGWIAGDLHMHTFYSDGADSVDEQLLSNISQGLYFGFLTDHNTARGLSEWTQGNRMAANIEGDGTERPFQALDGLEVTTEFGHYQSLGVGLAFDTYEVLLTDLERSKTGEALDDIIKDKIVYIADTIRREGGVPQINHPFSSNTMGFNYWDVADHFDTIEIWNGVFVPGDGRYESDNPSQQEQNYRSKMKWYELLNTIKDGGKYHAATGGTDNHETASVYTPTMEVDAISDMAQYNEVYKRNGKYSGVPTTYVYCPDAVDQQAILDALVAGHSFISNGVTALADVDGASYGDTAPLAGGTAALNVDLFCRDGFEKLQVIKNGEVMMEVPLGADLQQYQDTLQLEGLEDGDWIVLEVFGTETRYAITNPIFFGTGPTQVADNG